MLRKTTKQMGVTLEGELYENKGCSIGKRICMSIPSREDKGADKKLFRVFVDLRGKRHVTFVEGNKYTMIVRVTDAFSRHD